MKRFIKQYWKILLFFTLAGAAGGYFTGLYMLNDLPEALRGQIAAQGMNETQYALIAAVQAAAYGLILGAAGIFFAKNTSLWRDEKSRVKKPLLACGIVSLLGGAALILPDVFFFGRYSAAIADSYATKPTLPYVLAAVTYGAVIEEVICRLFLMSLIAFVLHKLFGKKSETPAASALAAANFISALLFAAGHLPMTFLTIGSSPLIVARCFLLNGCFGLAFGWLYRKYGLRWAMLAHGGCHIVSKLIWFLFI